MRLSPRTTTWRHRALLLLCLSSLAALAPHERAIAENTEASSSAKITRLDLSPRTLKHNQRSAYGVYMKGQKLGFALEEMKPSTFEGKPSFELNNSMVMVMQSFGDTTRQEFKSLSTFSSVPPYQLLQATEIQKTDKFSSEIVAALITRNQLQATIKAAGGEKTRTIDDFEYDLVDALGPLEWILGKPRVGESINSRSFEFSDLEKDVESMKVVEIKEIEVFGKKHIGYVLDFESRESDMKGTILIDDTGRVVNFKLLGIMEMKLEEEARAKVVDGKFDVFASGIIRPDKKLGNPTEVSLLKVELSGAGLEKLPNSFGQKVEYDAKKKTAIVTLGLKAEVKLPEATEKEIKEALRATVHYPVDDKEVKKLAARAVRKAKTDEEKVRKLVKFVDRYIRDEYGIDPLTVEDVIKEKRGDCSEHAALFATLGRAAGIPTREVSGVIYGDVELDGFGGHAWNEVVIDGKWYPVDPSWNEFVINATHIKFGHGNRKGAGTELLLGDLKMKVLELEKKKTLGGTLERLLRSVLE